MFCKVKARTAKHDVVTLARRVAKPVLRSCCVALKIRFSVYTSLLLLLVKGKNIYPVVGGEVPGLTSTTTVNQGIVQSIGCQ